MALSACGSSGDTADPRPAAKRTPAPERARSRPLPKVPGPLKPGVYMTDTKPRLELPLGPGWRVVNPDVIVLGDDPQAGPLLGVIAPPRVIDPEFRGVGEVVPQKSLLRAPSDLAGWLARHPAMTAEEPREASIGGRKLRLVDLRVTGGYRSRVCPGRCVLLFAFGPKQYGFLPTGSSLRAYVTPGPSGPVSIGVFGLGADLGPAEQVLKKARFVEG